MISEVYNCDNMELMAKYPDGYFELAIIDPPYGIRQSIAAGKDSGSHRGNSITKRKDYTVKDWDTTSPDEVFFKELKRVSKNQIIWGANHFIEKIPNPNSSSWIVWDKENGTNGYADCELAYSSFKTAVRQFTFRWHGMLQGDMKNKEQRIHPTQKPVALYKWLLQNYAKESDKILDTHLGSGSSRIAAHDMGFDFVGCELDKDYFDAAELRYQEHIKQLTLF